MTFVSGTLTCHCVPVQFIFFFLVLLLLVLRPRRHLESVSPTSAGQQGARARRGEKLQELQEILSASFGCTAERSKKRKSAAVCKAGYVVVWGGGVRGGMDE